MPKTPQQKLRAKAARQTKAKLFQEQMDAIAKQKLQLADELQDKPSINQVVQAARENQAINRLLETNPGNRNQQRKLLEQIGAQAVDQAVKKLGFNYDEYANTPQTMGNRLWLERAILMDDQDAYGGMAPAEYKQKYGKKAYKQARRDTRRENGGGIMNFTKDMMSTGASAASSLLPFLGLSSVSSVLPNLTQQEVKQQQEESKFVPQAAAQQPVGNEYNLDAVDMEYVESVIVPEDGYARQQQDEIMNTAISHGRSVYNVITNEQGDVGVYLFPNQPTQSDNTQLMAGSFMSVLNDVTFNPESGDQTPDPSFTAGPLNGVVSNIIQYKCTAFSVSFLPTESSLNNQGEMYETYYLKPPNTASDSSISITIGLSSLTNNYYYQSSNMKSILEKRMIKVPTLTDQFQYVTSANSAVAPPFNNFFYILFVGCVPNTTIGQLEVAYTYEFDPQITSLPICPTGQPNPGAMTPQLISNLFKEHKLLQSLDRRSARKVLECVRDYGPKTHDKAMFAFRKAMKLMSA